MAVLHSGIAKTAGTVMICHINERLNGLTATFLSIAIVALGFMPAANAAVVTTGDALSMEVRQDSLDRIGELLERTNVAERLLANGVSPADVAARVAALSDTELLEVQNALDNGVAGGDALGLIGAVFVVLLILELVGVTNVFSAI